MDTVRQIIHFGTGFPIGMKPEKPANRPPIAEETFIDFQPGRVMRNPVPCFLSLIIGSVKRVVLPYSLQTETKKRYDY